MIELLRQCGALMEKKLLNASKPPADAPMPTIKNEFDVRPAGLFLRLSVSRDFLR